MRGSATAARNREKAAILMMLLGSERVGQVMQYLDEEHVELISLEIARLDKVTPELRTTVITEFFDMAMAQDYIAQGGVEHAKKMLESAFGRQAADEMIERIMHALEVVPFDFLRKSDPTQLASMLQEEHPQTIALILAYLPSALAAQTITKLSPELRTEIAERIALMDRTPPEVIRRVEQVLERKFSSFAQSEFTVVGGVKALVELLNRVDRQTERKILETLGGTNPDLAEQVMNMMFVFEDIVNLDDRAVQAILREIEIKELSLALKGTSVDVQMKIFTNMSERAATMLKEDMEFLGPVKLKNVEEAQQKIVGVIRRLEEAGEVSIGRGEEDVLV